MDERNCETVINGTVESVIFRNEENGYAVLRLLRSDDDDITITGILPDISVGEELEARGTWVFHPSYGDQFSVASFTRRLPADEKGICDYLSSHAIKGIGERTARRIVERFGTDTFRVMSEEPEQLAEVRGITREKALSIGESFAEKTALRMLAELFMKNDVPARLAAAFYAAYGSAAIEIIRENPYILCSERWELDFADADRLAASLGIEQDDSIRIQEGIIYELLFNMQNGHTFIPSGKLANAAGSLLGVPPQLVFPAIAALEASERVVREEICGEDAVYLSELHREEAFLSEELIRRSRRTGVRYAATETELDVMLAGMGTEYSETQLHAIELAAKMPLLVLTGGPGTGKTTTVRGILRVFTMCGMKTVLAAPTGRAAARMGELCGGEASTIHRLLEAGYSAGGLLSFTRNEKNPIDADAVIVDEASMIDIRLAAALMRAVKPDTRIVFIGDPDQLPPVGPGTFLADMLACGVLPCVKLTEVFRQAAESDIIMNAHRINSGAAPHTCGGRDFYFISRNSPAEITRTVLTLCCERIPESFGIEPSHIQVLAPWRQRESGTLAVNRALSDALNPPDETKKEFRFGSLLFREGDRVMQIRNDYDLRWERGGGAEAGSGVWNGDIGTLICIDREADEAVVLFYDGRVVRYPIGCMGELEPAYAVTVHKSQGSEFDAVVLALADGPDTLLTRSVLYTAVTRAKKLFVVVGSERALMRMVENNRKSRRYCALAKRLSLAAGDPL